MRPPRSGRFQTRGKFASGFADGVRFFPFRGRRYLSLGKLDVELDGFGEVVLFRQGFLLLLLGVWWGPKPGGPWTDSRRIVLPLSGWMPMAPSEKTAWERLSGKDSV